MSVNFSDFISFFKKQFKSGSLILAVFIPILLLLSRFEFVKKDFMVVVNQLLIIIALVEVSVKLGLHFYLQAKIQVSEVQKQISEGKYDEAKQQVKDNLTEMIKLGKETAKELIEASKSGSEVETETEISQESNVNNQPEVFSR